MKNEILKILWQASTKFSTHAELAGTDFNNVADKIVILMEQAIQKQVITPLINANKATEAVKPNNVKRSHHATN